MAKKKTSSKKKQQKYKVGSIVAIPLPEQKKIAYAKIFKGYDLGVYDYLSDEIETVERVVKNKFLYFNAVTDKPVKDGTFIIIGEEPFLDEEAAWAPPMASGVLPGFPRLGVLRLFHKGNSRAALPGETTGMDIHTISPRAELFVAELVDRLVLRNLKKYRV